MGDSTAKNTGQPIALLIENNRIAQVFKVSEKNYYGDCQKLRQRWNTHWTDLGDTFLTPTWVNSHTHLAMSFFRALPMPKVKNKKNVIEDFYFKLENKLTPEDVFTFTKMGIVESLLHGVGCVSDHYYHGLAIAEACWDLEFPALVAPTLQDLYGPGCRWLKQQIVATETIVRRAQKSGAEYVQAAWGPHATDSVSPKLWGEIYERAQTLELPLHFHLAQTAQEFERIQKREKKSPVEFLAKQKIWSLANPKLCAHGIYLSRKDFSYLKSGNALLMACPLSQTIFQFPASYELWTKNKVPWSVATDCVASQDSLNPLHDLRFLQAQRALEVSNSKEYGDFSKKFKKGDLIKVTRRLEEARKKKSSVLNDFTKISSVPARFMGESFKAMGTLKKGGWANIIAWDTQHPTLWPASDPLAAIAFTQSSAAIANVMIMGEWRGEFGHYAESLLEKMNYSKILDECEKKLRRLL